MAIEAEIITPHLRGACVTDAKRIHMLFVPTAAGARVGQVPMTKSHTLREKVDRRIEEYR